MGDLLTTMYERGSGVAGIGIGMFAIGWGCWGIRRQRGTRRLLLNLLLIVVGVGMIVMGIAFLDAGTEAF